MIAQPVEQTIRVRRYAWSCERNQRAERGGLALERDLNEQIAIDVGVKCRVVFDKVSTSFNRNRVRRGAHRQSNTSVDRHHGSDIDIFCH
jgi:hypothetical protein